MKISVPWSPLEILRLALTFRLFIIYRVHDCFSFTFNLSDIQWQTISTSNHGAQMGIAATNFTTKMSPQKDVQDVAIAIRMLLTTIRTACPNQIRTQKHSEILQPQSATVTQK